MCLGSKNNNKPAETGGVTYFSYNDSQPSQGPNGILEVVSDEDVDEVVDRDSGPTQPVQQEDCDFNTNALDELPDGPNSASFTDEIPAGHDQYPTSSLPGFVKWPSFPNLEYVTFLQSQNVFSLPPTSVQCELVKSFVEYIYPRMPLLDLEGFLGCINCSNGSSGQLGLALYSAILFAGSTHVDQEVVSNYGYSDRRLLSKELYKRTQVSRHLNSA